MYMHIMASDITPALNILFTSDYREMGSETSVTSYRFADRPYISTDRDPNIEELMQNFKTDDELASQSFYSSAHGSRGMILLFCLNHSAVVQIMLSCALFYTSGFPYRPAVML